MWRHLSKPPLVTSGLTSGQPLVIQIARTGLGTRLRPATVRARDVVYPINNSSLRQPRSQSSSALSLVLSRPRRFRMWRHLSKPPLVTSGLTSGQPLVIQIARTGLGTRLRPATVRARDVVYPINNSSLRQPRRHAGRLSLRKKPWGRASWFWKLRSWFWDRNTKHNKWRTKTVHQYVVSIQSSTKVHETFREITQKLLATETWDFNKLFKN